VKKGYWVILALVLLSIVVSVIFISMMPDQVPMHYNAAGQVDRMGSKYENLIFPGAMVVIGASLLLAGQKKDLKRSEEIVVLSTGISLLVVFNVLNAILLYKALTYETGATLDMEISKLIFVVLGVLFVVLGNVMPKVRRNNMVGLRTRWSKSSDSVWQKSQRFGGIASVICGILLLIGALFLNGETAAVILIVLLVAWATLCVGASYAYYKKEQAD
jgi:uncharacterized membrane protein